MNNTRKILVGFDKDGTLDSTSTDVPEELISYCRTLKEKNKFDFFLSTGRNLSEIGSLLNKFGDLFSYISTENGGIIFDKILDKKIFINGHETNPNLIKLVESVTKKFGHLITKGRRKETIWSAEFEENLDIVAIYCNEFILNHKLQLKIYPHGNYNGTIDIVPHNVNKVNIIKLFPNDSQIYFFGDSENDYELLAHAQVIPGTVQNAKPEILKLVGEKKGFISQEKWGLGVLSGMKNYFA